MQKPGKIILGIDPGTLFMGYSLLLIEEQQLRMMDMDVLKLSGKKDNYERLQLIHQTVSYLITQFRPDCFAIEAPFFGKNVQSMLKLGRAQGVAIAAAMGAGLPVFEYSPRKIKQSITGNGNADKEQVWRMLQHLCLLREKQVKSYDASDALAVAVCHHFQHKVLPVNKKTAVKGWSDFISKNAARVRTARKV